MSFYTWLRSRCPLTHRGFQNRMNLDKQDLIKHLDTIYEKIQSLSEEQRTYAKAIKQLQQENCNLQASLLEIKKQNEENRNRIIESRRAASEGVWGEIFNQCIRGSSWLKDTSFSPGRWAIGYQYLYPLYRILNELHPQNILELGLGQSTKMIAQYAANFPHVQHQVVEHDPEWISFFQQGYTIPKNTKIVQLGREFVPYKEANKVRVFKGFKEYFRGQKFNLISLDAPLGGDMKQYARIDVLQMLPDILADNWIILIDDCNRSGEQHTVQEMERVFKQSNIAYAKGKYSGMKDCVVLTSYKLKFVCSM